MYAQQTRADLITAARYTDQLQQVATLSDATRPRRSVPSPGEPALVAATALTPPSCAGLSTTRCTAS
jgi:hypothetical protein